MEEIGKALPWVGFWLFASVVWWCDHQQYMAGHNAMFFTHKTDEEKTIRAKQVSSD